jgi:SAM-dependent methyltransferase
MSREVTSDILATRYPEIDAGGFSRIDGTIAFYQRVNALLTPAMTVLDFGAGRGAFMDDPCEYRRDLRNLKGRVRELIGVDIDEAVRTNPFLDRAILCEPNGRIELPDGAVDLVVSDFTFEHLEFPDLVAAELDRILRPGGWLCARTMNRNGYIALFNRMINSRWHPALIGWLQPNRKQRDVFPAFYRLNSRSALRRCFAENRFHHSVYTWDSEPRYFGKSLALLRAFDLIHAMTPSSLKTTIMIFLKKSDLAKDDARTASHAI